MVEVRNRVLELMSTPVGDRDNYCYVINLGSLIDCC